SEKRERKRCQQYVSIKLTRTNVTLSTMLAIPRIMTKHCSIIFALGMAYWDQLPQWLLEYLAGTDSTFSWDGGFSGCKEQFVNPAWLQDRTRSKQQAANAPC